MKINSIGEETNFGKINAGDVFYDEDNGCFCMKTTEVGDDPDAFYDAVRIEDGRMVKYFNLDTVLLYPNAALSLCDNR